VSHKRKRLSDAWRRRPAMLCLSFAFGVYESGYRAAGVMTLVEAIAPVADLEGGASCLREGSTPGTADRVWSGSTRR
jgi:hypothetical protein